MPKRCIVVGASHAAAGLVANLRKEGWEGEILLLGDEPHLPYHRPPLSKAFLSGEKQLDELLIRPAGFYEKNEAAFRQGTVAKIDRDAKTISLADGETISYDKLALCTGARVRKAALPGSELNGVHYLRTLADVEGIKADLGEGKSAVIIGGGYVGLETAASLRKQGINVVVLEMAPRILQRVAPPELSAFYARIHQQEGVQIHTGITVTAITGNGKAERVIRTDGIEHPADIVIIGIGVIPNVELAQEAGLEVDNGIVVDEACRTSDADIVAAGDCTNHYSPIYDRRIRLESVPNANDQSRVAAATICGKDASYNTLPWFWSDQYDMKLQIAGLSQGYDQIVIRGDKDNSRSFAAFYLQQGRIIAADCVNRAQEFMLCKSLIAAGQSVDPVMLADEGNTVRELLEAAR